MRSTSLPDHLKHLYEGVTSLLESEVRLAKTEIQYGAQDTARQAKILGFCTALAAPGVLAMLAFLIIGLGNMLGKNYWLSALIVSVVLLVSAALIARRSLARIKEDARLRESRESLRQSKVTLTETMARIRRIP